MCYVSGCDGSTGLSLFQKKTFFPDNDSISLVFQCDLSSKHGVVSYIHD